MAREKVKLWNEGPEDYKQTWKGDVYEIKKGAFLVMSRRDANDFMGTMSGMSRDGKPIVKKLRMEQLDSGKPESSFICNLCGQDFKDKQALDEHTKTHADRVMKENPRKA